MYRWLLCFRYLRTRYIALASIISVTLGVATLIVVNSVMAGFSAEMHDRLHGLASDILIESSATGGMANPEKRMAEIRDVIGNDLAASSVSVHVPAMLNYTFNDQPISRHVQLVGIDETTYDTVSDFSGYLLHPENQNEVSFDLRSEGYDQGTNALPESGWTWRRKRVAQERYMEEYKQRQQALLEASRPDPEPTESDNTFAAGPSSTFADSTPSELMGDRDNVAATFDPMTEQYPGIILGISTCSTKWRDADGNVVDTYYARPGDDVRMMFSNASEKLQVLSESFTVVDLYESGMSEYDSSFAFVPLKHLQECRGMVDPSTGARSVTTIQLKLTEGADLNVVRDKLRQRFPAEVYGMQIQTWRDMQGPLLSAVQLETTILNILLFLIIAVAGFGILATFFMIVVEKTRDIGTLKALGASGSGVMSIFLSYGLLLGIVGSGVGLVGGLVFVDNINKIARLIERITGQEVFDPTVYYFTEIPTIINPFTLTWVMIGAITIAVIASVLPALRAARMHPVQALRFE